MPARIRLGIDLGGTKIEILALDADGRECLRERIATPQGDYEGTVEAIAGLVAMADQRLGVSGTIGIGMPGSISPFTGRVRNANSTCLNDRTLREDLIQRIGRPIRLANDANCFAVSEARDGAGAGAASVMGVILGTGVGAGFVIDGRPLEGAQGLGGEWGHNPLPIRWQLLQGGTFAQGLPDLQAIRPIEAGDPDPRRQWPWTREDAAALCYCGRIGCVETWLSGPGWAQDHALSTQGVEPGRSAPTPAARTGKAQTVVTAMRAGDPQARASFTRYVDRLARSLAGVINIVDPEVIVLGGGMSAIDEIYRELPDRLPAYVFSDSVKTRIERNRHGDSSGVRGAAWLWRDGEGPA